MPFYGGTNDLTQTPEQYLVPTGPMNIVVVHRNEVILTSGSDLNVAAVSSGPLGNPWPKILGVFMQRLFKGSWRPNNLREVTTRNLPGNYGSVTSKSLFSFRGREFGGIGNMPGGRGTLVASHSIASRPTYNNLVPIVYGLRDIDPKAVAQASDLVQLPVFPGPGSAVFQPAPNATLQEQIL